FSKAVKPAATWLLLSLAAWGGALWLFGFARLGPLPEVASTVEAAAPALGDRRSEENALTLPDRFGKGDTLSSVLSRNGFGSLEVHEIGRALSAVMDVRHLRDGDEVDIHFAGGSVASILVHHGDFERVLLMRSDLGWQSERTAVDLERRTVALSGALEDNLFLSMAALGEAAPLTVAFANVFSWDFDFHTQSRQGDRFSLVVDKLYREGELVGYGDLHAARYVSGLGGERVFSAFLYDDPTGRRDYYDSDGKSLKKAFLRAPVEFDRISSGFSYNRLHPIHRRRMPHLGVDYAARKGTPVYSVAAGVVVDRGWRGGGGNTVTVQHPMGYTSKYLHLSKFAKRIAVGTRVAQKEVIGYVGDTGTATAAHLDFRLLRHGKPVNPLTQIFPPGPPVPAEFRADFDKRKAVLEAGLGLLEKKAAVTTDD
ncbi:MAG: peptidoglycan DD-metalloendopeptidase family protein, partial [Vicinamibacteria bacterium]